MKGEPLSIRATLLIIVATLVAVVIIGLLIYDPKCKRYNRVTIGETDYFVCVPREVKP